MQGTGAEGPAPLVNGKIDTGDVLAVFYQSQFHCADSTISGGAFFATERPRGLKPAARQTAICNKNWY